MLLIFELDRDSSYLMVYDTDDSTIDVVEVGAIYALYQVKQQLFPQLWKHALDITCEEDVFDYAYSGIGSVPDNVLYTEDKKGVCRTKSKTFLIMWDRRVKKLVIQFKGKLYVLAIKDYKLYANDKDTGIEFSNSRFYIKSFGLDDEGSLRIYLEDEFCDVCIYSNGKIELDDGEIIFTL